MADDATCLSCGCTDSHACRLSDGQPCSWLRVDRETGVGVCSDCPSYVTAFDSRARMAQLRHEAR